MMPPFVRGKQTRIAEPSHNRNERLHDRFRRNDIMADETKYRVIGTRPVRPDGVDKVTGRAIYGADVVLPRMVHGKVVRSPHAHARIKKIDATKALALPGVLAVVTSEDLPSINATANLGEGGDVNL